MYLLVAAYALIAFGPDTSGSSVTYRFTTTMDRPQGAFCDRESDASPPPPRVEMQTIAFATIDRTHVRLTVVDQANPKPDSLVADRAPDGTLHAKLNAEITGPFQSHYTIE